MMTQITYQFKKLQFKDERKRLQRSLKKRKQLEKIQKQKPKSSIKPLVKAEDKLPQDVKFSILGFFGYEE